MAMITTAAQMIIAFFALGQVRKGLILGLDCESISILGLIKSLIECSIRSQVTQVLLFCYFDLSLSLLANPQVH